MMSHSLRPTFALLRRIPALFGLLPLILLAGCEQPDRLQSIRNEGILRVITRNGPTTYYQDRHGPAGFEYELARQFAEQLGVKLEITTRASLDQLFDALRDKRADIAAAGLTVTGERQQDFHFAPPYLDIDQLVLVRSGRPVPLAAGDLVGRTIHIIADGDHGATLAALKDEHPELEWIESADVETVDLLEELNEGVIDATVIDSNEFIANRAFYPQLRSAFRIGEKRQLAWAVARTPQNETLLAELERFFERLRESGQLAQLIERHYSHSEDNNPLDSLAFTRRTETVLPKYLEAIQQTAETYDLDWRLLAAIAYQESHWNPHATSFTGVRGFMMLTLPTAKAMGVTNRTDVHQSLDGGARYFLRIHQMLPARIREPDRTWFALAAYNVGLGHLEDARRITQKQGKDPDKWSSVKEHLPLLARRQWYSQTRYGYARGSEPVRFVQNIRHYYNVLTWSDVAKQRTPPRKITEQYLPDGFDLTLNAL
jgi:membrane-bound lytic murein transglycosylase F